MKFQPISKRLRRLESLICMGAAITLIAGCGNTWLSSSSRSQTPSALLLTAKQADDSGNHDKAIDLYRQVLAADPTNDEARVRLAYALNAKAGLGLLDLVEKLPALSATATPGATPTPTTTTAATGTSNSSILTVGKLVGLSDSEKATMIAGIGQSAAASMASYRAISTKLALLHESWLALCRIMPNDLLASTLSDPVTNSALEGSKCEGGIDPNSVRSATRFGAVMELMAEAMIIYQTVLDKNGTGQIDLLTQATAVNADILSVQGKIAATTGTGLTTLLTQLNNDLAQLKQIGQTFKGEAVSIALADFTMIGSLITSIDGLPDDLKNNLTTSLTGLLAARDKMNSFSTAANTTTTSGTSAQASTTLATNAFNNLNNKIANDNTLSPAAKADAQAQMQDACTNFDSVKTIYNLPATTQKPTGCTSSSLVDEPARAPMASGMHLQNVAHVQPEDENVDIHATLVDFAKAGLGFLW